MKFKVRRETSIWVKFFLDECLPPVVRDSFLYRWFQHTALGKSAPYFIDFRNIFRKVNHNQLATWYSKVENDNFHTTSDLSAASINAIRSHIEGQTVLDVACGLGFLSQTLGLAGHTVAAVDFVLSKKRYKHPKVTYIKANIEQLPFPDDAFDTTVSAHTLEHTLDINKAIGELRRVTKKKLIVIVPKERPYKYGCNFHTYFFPYDYNVFQTFGYLPKKQSLSLVGGDWFYTEMLG